MGIELYNGQPNQVDVRFKMNTRTTYPLLLEGSMVGHAYGLTREHYVVIDHEGRVRYRTPAGGRLGTRFDDGAIRFAIDESLRDLAKVRKAEAAEAARIAAEAEAAEAARIAAEAEAAEAARIAAEAEAAEAARIAAEAEAAEAARIAAEAEAAEVARIAAEAEAAEAARIAAEAEAAEAARIAAEAEAAEAARIAAEAEAAEAARIAAEAEAAEAARIAAEAEAAEAARIAAEAEAAEAARIAAEAARIAAEAEAMAEAAEALAGMTAVLGEDAVPGASALFGNYPNPFNAATTIRFRLAQAGPAVLSIYDVRGQLVRQLRQGVLAGGEHLVSWDGRDNRGGAVATGVYVTRLAWSSSVQARKMLLLR